MRRLSGAFASWAAVLVLLLAASWSTVEATDPFEAGSSIMPSETARPGAERQEIVAVDPATLTCDGIITFEDVTGGPEPGTNYDVIFESDGADFAERFAGQSLTYTGDFDVLSGTPSNPLALAVGLPNENVGVEYYAPWMSQVLYGLGPVGYPNYDAVGEGCFAVLFDFDQSEFGFDLLGGDGGNAYVSFFKRDGSLIDVYTITGITAGSYGFQRVGGINDIAGISIHNDDPAGIGIDNLCHDVGGVPGHPPTLDIKPTSCPNPLNVNSKGVLPVAIVGTPEFDVTEVDAASVLLMGVAPLRYAYCDVTAPFVPAEPCDCSEEGPDGIVDMTLKFATQEIVGALGTYEDGDEIVLALELELLDGTAFEIYDCVWILDKKKDQLTTAFPGPEVPAGDLKETVETTSWTVIKALYR